MPRSQLRIEETISEVTTVNPYYNREVPHVEVPVRPKIGPKMPPDTQLRVLQKYISQFQYNFLPRTFFNCYKYRPLNRILETAKEVMKEALPIRCLEATFLAIHLTQDLKHFERYPLTFKTHYHGQICRHIVLAVRCEGHGWGALGLSRKEDLMYKKLRDMTLSELVEDYRQAYKGHGHEVLAVKIGLQVSRNGVLNLIPCWRFLCLSYKCHSEEEIRESLGKYAAMAGKLAAEWEAMRRVPAVKVKKDKAAALQPSEEEKKDKDTQAKDDEQYNDAAEMEDSDGDETNEVLQSILANRSPFRRNQYTNGMKPSTPLSPASPAKSLG
eukprot:TRINITY_DN4790_c0_g1_i1.p2 TRINITY_DN4790_c0_g1~~TRINITY_DN4790_c0_g1_i1.p2  ORF type:complete len:327 (+),score=112.29 TRINITY_DN4790_c0_g1_i1:1254-2234(+)